VDLRRYQRTPVDLDITFTPGGDDASVLRGRARDLSLGGMFIETRTPLAFGTPIVITLFNGESSMLLPAISRWTREDGMGVQFGLIGAKDTHAITEMTR
jgi:c-di-GMP-binding flagellar brake protein YcgR